MLRCKQVSDALATSRYWELPLRKRIGMRMHVMFCFVCGRYNKNIMVLQDAARGYLAHREEPAPGDSLSGERRARIKSALARGA